MWRCFWRLPRLAFLWLLPTVALCALVSGPNRASAASAPTWPAEPQLPAGWAHIESTPDGRGYWTLAANGSIQGFGSAVDLGGTGKLQRGEVAVTMSAVPTGDGYWIFTNRGRVIVRGTAASFGDASALKLVGPIVDSVATPSGRGYYLVASDGGVFAYGDARFHGSMGGKHLNASVRAIAPTPTGDGYWLAASDGGVFAFDAPFRGSMGGTHLNAPVDGVVPYGNGYALVAADGGVFVFSDLPFTGSLGSAPPATAVVSITSNPTGTGYWLLDKAGDVFGFGGATDLGSPVKPSAECVAHAYALDTSTTPPSLARIDLVKGGSVRLGQFPGIAPGSSIGVQIFQSCSVALVSTVDPSGTSHLYRYRIAVGGPVTLLGEVPGGAGDVTVDGNFVFNGDLATKSIRLRRIDDGSAVSIDTRFILEPFTRGIVLIDPTAQVAVDTSGTTESSMVNVRDITNGHAIRSAPFGFAHVRYWSADHKTVVAYYCSGSSRCDLAVPYVIHLDTGTENLFADLDYNYLHVVLAADGQLIDGAGSDAYGRRVDIYDQNFVPIRHIDPGPITFYGIIPAR